MVDAGGAINSVTVTASNTGNPGGVTDRSDDGDDTDGNTTDDNTELGYQSKSDCRGDKTASITDSNNNNINDLGDIWYTP